MLLFHKLRRKALVLFLAGPMLLNVSYICTDWPPYLVSPEMAKEYERVLRENEKENEIVKQIAAQVTVIIQKDMVVQELVQELVQGLLEEWRDHLKEKRDNPTCGWKGLDIANRHLDAVIKDYVNEFSEHPKKRLRRSVRDSILQIYFVARIGISV